MITDTEFAITSSLHALEKEGVKRDAAVTFSALMAAMHPVLAEVRALKKQIAALEKALNGQQKKLDHTESHALSFRGAWQAAERYYPGDVVRFMEGVYTALKDISPGKAEPGRNGSGWDRIV